MGSDVLTSPLVVPKFQTSPGTNGPYFAHDRAARRV